MKEFLLLSRFGSLGCAPSLSIIISDAPAYWPSVSRGHRRATDGGNNYLPMTRWPRLRAPLRAWFLVKLPGAGVEIFFFRLCIFLLIKNENKRFKERLFDYERKRWPMIHRGMKNLCVFLHTKETLTYARGTSSVNYFSSPTAPVYIPVRFFLLAL